MEKLLLIDISTETPARIIEKDLFMAQCIANIDRYGHPDPTNPAKAKDTVRLQQIIDI